MKKTMNEIFSTNLRNALYMSGKTQADLARAVKVSETAVSMWTNGSAVPRPQKVDQICAALRCSREDLMIDHERQVLFAPEDILAGEMRSRPDLYGVFNAIMQLNDSDVKLLLKIVKRMTK